MADTSKLNILPVYKLVGRKWRELSTVGNVTQSDTQAQKLQSKDLNSKTIVELEELIERHRKILNNEKFLLRLKDKGQKLRGKYEEISAALESARAAQNRPSSQIIDGVPQDATSLEWRQNKETSYPDSEGDHIPSDVESDLEEEGKDVANPLQLLASHSQIPKRRKRKPLVDPADLIKDELKKLSLEDSSPLQNPKLQEKEIEIELDVSSKLLKKSEKAEESQGSMHKFRPYRPLKEPPDRRDKVRNPALWVESSATGPLLPTSNRPARIIPIRESVCLVQKIQQTEKEKQLEAARMHLKHSQRFEIGIPSNHLGYRDVNTSHHILDDSEEEEDFDFVTSSFS